MYSMTYNFGIDETDLQSLLHAQQGCCKICGVDFGTVKSKYDWSYCIDHNHLTGTVRGLLCLGCNVALWHIENTRLDPLKFMEYLEAEYAL